MSVDGTWNIFVKSSRLYDFVATFKQDGDTVTGTAEAAGDSQPIQDGWFNGTDISWKISVTTPMAMLLEFVGMLDGDSLSGTVQAGEFGSYPGPARAPDLRSRCGDDDG